MSNTSTKQTVTRNVIWRFAEQCGAEIVTLVVSIILARLLEPEAYGTLALVTVFISLMQVFIGNGLPSALVQKKDSDDLDFSSVFYFNLSICIFLYAILFFAAPMIATFYEDESLTAVIRVLGINLLINGVRGIQFAYVSRTMQFKKFFYSTMGGSLGSAVVGIVLAYAGFGIWALVLQQLINNFVGTIILWITVRCRPRLMFSFERLKGLLSFSWKLLVMSLIDVLYRNLCQLIIGKRYSTEDLAYYNKGEQFPRLISDNLNTSIDGVLFPVMSKEQDDNDRLHTMFRRSISVGVYIVAPIMAGLFVCAEPLIKILLTEKWLFCVPFLRIFCLMYVFFPIGTAISNTIKAKGRTDLLLNLNIIKKLLGLGIMLSATFISTKAMAYGMLASTFLSFCINVAVAKKILRYSFRDQIKDILPNIVLAVGMGIPVFLIQWLALSDIVILILQVLVGIILYIGLSILMKFSSFIYIWSIVKGMLFNRKGEKHNQR